MRGQHRGLRLTRRQRRQHPARILSDQLNAAMDRFFWYLSDDELVAIGLVRGALHRIADEQESGNG